MVEARILVCYVFMRLCQRPLCVTALDVWHGMTEPGRLGLLLFVHALWAWIEELSVEVIF